MKTKKEYAKYKVWGTLPGIGDIKEYTWAWSGKQALKIVRIRLEERYKGEKIVIPPLSYYCQVEKEP